MIGKLQRGASVADVGCGHGWSTVVMAKEFPNSNFVGYDFHPSSIDNARLHAKEHRVDGNTHFEVATAKEYPGSDFDLVTFFDCLHDLVMQSRCEVTKRRSSRLTNTAEE